MVWVLIGVLGAYISKDFGLTAAQKGFMAAIPLLGGSLVRIPLGLMVDHIGPKKTGVVGQVLVMVPLAALWLFGPSWNHILIFGLLLGIAGGSFAVALPLASRWYPPKHQGMALGIAGAGNSGTVLASLFAPKLAEIFGWRSVFGLALIPVALVLGVFLFLAKESPDKPEPKKLSEYFSVFKEADTFWFCFFYSITFGGFVGLASFLGIFFHDQYGLSKVNAGYFTALCVAGGSFLRPFGGYLADHFGGVRVLSVLFGVIAGLMAAVSFLPALGVHHRADFYLDDVPWDGQRLGVPARAASFPQRDRRDDGVVGAAGGLGGFFLPTLLGVVKERAGSYGFGFAIFALTSFAALVTLKMVQSKWTFAKLVPSLAEPKTLGVTD